MSGFGDRNREQAPPRPNLRGNNSQNFAPPTGTSAPRTAPRDNSQGTSPTTTRSTRTDIGTAAGAAAALPPASGGRIDPIGWVDKMLGFVAGGLENAFAAEEAQDPYQAALGGGSGGGGGYGAVQAQLDQQLQQALANIDQLYNEQVAQAGKGKEASSAQLAQILTQHKAQLAAVANEYAAQKAQIQASLAKTYADVNAKVSQSQQQAAQVLQTMGVDASRLMPGFMQQQSYMDQQQGAQGAYDQRIGQLGSANLASRQANAENINAAGQTQLATEYAQLQNKLNLWKLQQQQSAQGQYQEGLRQIAMASASGGGGGGGGGSSEDGISASMARLLNYEMDVQKFDFEREKFYTQQQGNNPFDMSMLEGDGLAYLGATQGTLKDAVKFITDYTDDPEAIAQATYNLTKASTRKAPSRLETNRSRIRSALERSYSNRTTAR